MKRTRIEDDFNPVYPYDTFSTPSIPYVAPPFVSSDGLQEKPPGVLALKYTDPITTNAKHELTLKLGSNITLENGLLSATVPTVSPPLTNSNNSLGLATSAPIAVSANSLTLATAAPLTVSNNQLSINAGRGLVITNNAVAVNPTGALGFNNTGALQLNAAGGMRVDGANLILHVAYPFEAVNQLTLRLENGLEVTSGGKLNVKLGSGLQFDSNGRIAISNSNRTRSVPSLTTIWSISPTPNCSIYETQDANLFLCLTKNGAHVLGTITIKGLKGALREMHDNALYLKLPFDNQGNLLNCALESSTWRYQETDAVASNALTFMPNSTVYPRNKTADPGNMLIQISPNITFSVVYNEINSGYAFTFKWSAEPGKPFHPPTAVFCYITEQ